MKRKLTKKILKESNGGDLTLSKCGEWLTNGCWAIRRDLVEDGALYGNRDVLRVKFGDLAADPAKEGPYIGNSIPRAQSWETFRRLSWTVSEVPKYGGRPTELAVYVGDRGHVAFLHRPSAELIDPWGELQGVAEHVEGTHVAHRLTTEASGAWNQALAVRNEKREGEPTEAIIMPYKARSETVRLAQVLANELRVIDLERKLEEDRRSA